MKKWTTFFASFLIACMFYSPMAQAADMTNVTDKDIQEWTESVQTLRQASEQLKATNADLAKKLTDLADKKEQKIDEHKEKMAKATP